MIVGYKNTPHQAYHDSAIQTALAALVEAIRDENVTRTHQDEARCSRALANLRTRVSFYALERRGT